MIARIQLNGVCVGYLGGFVETKQLNEDGQMFGKVHRRSPGSSFLSELLAEYWHCSSPVPASGHGRATHFDYSPDR